MSKQRWLIAVVAISATILLLLSLSCSQMTPKTPDPSKYLDKTRQESYNTELHNIETAVVAMLADSNSSVLDTIQTNVNDMGLVTAGGGTRKLSSYLDILNPDGTVKSGCTYDFTRDGRVAQHSP
ncbi:hypothetical protein ACFLUS_05845 [Chloroflexota bacterium]